VAAASQRTIEFTMPHNGNRRIFSTHHFFVHRGRATLVGIARRRQTMRNMRNVRREWAGDDAANVAVAAAGGIVAALLAMVLAMGELAGLVHEQFAMLPL